MGFEQGGGEGGGGGSMMPYDQTGGGSNCAICEHAGKELTTLRAINFDHEIGFHAAEEEITRLQAENERLKQQLAAMTQERDGLKEDLDAVRRETWVKVAKSFDKKFFATDKRLDNTRDYRVDEFYAWCRAQAAHGGPHDDPR
jgi:hypothetical protein